MKMTTVVLGVTGGIACYKACDLVSRLVKNNFEVHVIMTKNACEFVTPLTFQTLSSNKVVTDMFENTSSFDVEHISLAQSADIFVVAPATANFIGKAANGIADDMLTTTVMATKAPLIIAPAMNTNMWENPILKDNLEKLKKFGVQVVAPDEGRLACGDIGKGKLAEVEEILEVIGKAVI
jgi:phosphopantothenoylcysteine decarboxylase/phosphopantothenate--cysteine ligase